MASNIYQMTVNKITYEISMGNDVEKYRTIVNNYYRVKQITLAERDSLLELIDNAYVVEEPEETEELEEKEVVEEE
jgi:L-arabinose isomerase